MTNKAQLYARRREMYRLYAQQSSMTEILDRLSTKYNISRQALWQDWQKRTNWVYDVFDLEPARVLPPVWFANGAWTCVSTQQCHLTSARRSLRCLFVSNCSPLWLLIIKRVITSYQFGKIEIEKIRLALWGMWGKKTLANGVFESQSAFALKTLEQILIRSFINNRCFFLHITHRG